MFHSGKLFCPNNLTLLYFQDTLKMDENLTVVVICIVPFYEPRRQWDKGQFVHALKLTTKQRTP